MERRIEYEDLRQRINEVIDSEAGQTSDGRKMDSMNRADLARRLGRLDGPTSPNGGQARYRYFVQVLQGKKKSWPVLEETADLLEQMGYRVRSALYAQG